MMFGFLPPADAHTDFASSTPADGDVLDQPVSEIRLRFTAASIVAGDGFVVLTPRGELVMPVVRVSDDASEFTLVLDPPLTAGVVGVQWSVRAGDAHPIEGTLSFTTTASAPAPDPALSPAVEATEAVEEVEEVGNPQPTTAAEATPFAETEAAGDAGVSELETSPSVELDQTMRASEQAVSAAAQVSLEEFLDDDADNTWVSPLAYLGRLASQAGSLLVVGIVAFAFFVSKRSERDYRMFVSLIRQATLLIIAGALLRAITLTAELGGLGDALIGWTGLAIGLRAAAAGALLAGTVMRPAVGYQATVPAIEPVVSAVGGGSFSGAIGLPEASSASLSAKGRFSEAPVRIDPAAYLLAAIIAGSFAFDGHTVTKGNHLLTGLVAAVHVTGAGVWLGGLICLVLLARRRGSGTDRLEFVTAVARFSVVAAAALAAVGAAGLVLTVTILDSVSELWDTAWGRILMAKVLIVAVAAAAGAFNHFVLVPQMQSRLARPNTQTSFVRTMAIEVIALSAAVALTAFLVAAAS